MAVMADAASTAAWFTLAGALGGVLLTSAVALTTAVLNHRWQTQSAERQLLQEHVRQLRQERRETYAHYWSAWNRFNHQLRTLRGEARKLAEHPDPQSLLAEVWSDVAEHPDPQSLLGQLASDVVEQAWTLELEWREAADELLLIGGQAVVDAALAHIETTEQRLDAAWKGEGHPGGDTYRELNDAMRTELLQPTKP